MSKVMAAAVIFAAISAQSMPTAVEQFAVLLQQGHAAHASGDKAGYLQSALKVRELLNDAPDAVEATAQAYAEAGDIRQGLAALGEFADLGQADDSLLSDKDQKFSALHSLPEYQSILERFAKNKTPVSLAVRAFALPDAGILPEDIDYDAESKSFLITSVLEKKIIRVGLDGKQADFADRRAAGRCSRSR